MTGLCGWAAHHRYYQHVWHDASADQGPESNLALLRSLCAENARCYRS